MKKINEDIKPTLKDPVSDQSRNFEKNFKKTMIKNQIKLIEDVDELLTEKEYSVKKKIFKLPKMEALVFSDPKLLAVYNEMSEEGEEKYGYHYNETIMNIIFNDYVLNSPKYLQKYKMAIPKEKKRRDKSGINQAKKAGEEIIKKMNPQFKVKEPEIKPAKVATEGVEVPEHPVKVLFLINEKDIENPDLFAYFPEINHDREGKFKMSYSHTGQHAAVHPSYAKESREALPYEYKNLKAELEGIGYNLEVLNQTNETTGAGASSGAFTPALGYEKNVDETTSTGSVGGSGMASGGYVGPAAWGSGDLMKTGGKSRAMRRPIWPGGSIIQESNYLIDPTGFEKFAEMLNEESDVDYIRSHSEEYGSVDKMNPVNRKLIKKDIQTGVLDRPNINEKATSKAQQRLFGMAHAVQKGELSPKKVGGAVKKIAKTVSPKDVKDFASTKHDKLPEKVDENKLVDFLETKAIEIYGTKYDYLKPHEKDNLKAMVGNYEREEDIDDSTIQTNEIGEDTQTMIQNNGTSMSNKSTPTGEQSSNVDMGTRGMGGMNEEINNKYLYESKNMFEELDKELEAYSIHHNKLKVMAEDRKPSALVLRDRVGSENEKNFKKDLGQSGTKEIIDVEKELQWKDQQTDVPKDPQKLGLDIEKKQIKTTDATGDEHLKNVGDSTNDKGDEIPKRNMSDDEQHLVDMMRQGLHSTVFDTKPSERFEDRMKADMGDKIYKTRQDQMEFKSKAPMYEKDTQPMQDSEDEKTEYNRFKTGWQDEKGLNESMVTGKYRDLLGKTRLIDFQLNEVHELTNLKDTKKYFELNFAGLGNAYCSKVEVNEAVVKILNEHKFYTDGVVVYRWKVPIQRLIESENKKQKTKINEQFEKMKHLTGYKPSDFVNTNNVKKNRGF